MSPMQRTLKYYRAMGYTRGIVEHWNPFARIRQDLFGFIDIVVLAPGMIIGAQACAGASHSARRTKILVSPLSREWLEAGGKIVVISWAKRKVVKGGKKEVWQCREEGITFEDLDRESKKLQLRDSRA